MRGVDRLAGAPVEAICVWLRTRLSQAGARQAWASAWRSRTGLLHLATGRLKWSSSGLAAFLGAGFLTPRLLSARESTFDSRVS
jgi:hypothetical protein